MIETLRQKTSLGIKIFIWGIIAFITGCELVYANPPTNTDTSGSSFVIKSFLLHPDTNTKVKENHVKAGLLYDVENKRIVWQKGMDNSFPIASLTKMMVALLTVEDIHAGKVQWDNQVMWTREIVIWKNRKKVKSYSQANYTLQDLFKNAMIASNNEASEQLARYLGGGNLDATIQRMNMRARELGMNSTYYGNPTGLPSRWKLYDNSSTPIDLLRLTLEMLKYDEIIHVTRMGYADIGNGKSTTIIRNHNRLTIDYKGEVDGMKTGYTRRAGFCLVASSYKCDHRLISIVLGARAPQTRNEIVRDMFNDYYSSIGLDKLSPFCNAPEQITEAGSTNNEDADSPEGEYMYKTKVDYKTHTVKKGEYLSYIADKYNVTATQIKSWNHLKSGRVRTGQKLVVKTTIHEKVWVTKDDQPANKTKTQVSTEKKLPEKSLNHTVEDTSCDCVYHVIQPGDTLFTIAKRYQGITVEKLQEINKISDVECLVPGTKIKVPVGS